MESQTSNSHLTALDEFRRPLHGDEVQVSEISKSIKEKGAVIIRNLIEPHFSVELREALTQCLDEDDARFGKDYIFRGMVHALMTRNQCFRDLLEDHYLIRIIKEILGHGAIIHAYNSSSMPPGNSNFSRSIHVDCPRLIPNYITNLGVTIALDPFKVENGAMEIWPLSYSRENKPTEEEFENNFISLSGLNPGDAVVFNARCWHRGGINQTKGWRHSVTMNLCRAYMRQQFDYPRMFEEDMENDFSEGLKQILGYHVRSPKSMDQFLLPPELRMYRPGQE